MKKLYVHGIVKDYDESINSINKYLFSENERLNAIIDDLDYKINKAKEILSNILVVKRYNGDYGSVKNTTKQEVYKAICMLDEILGGDSDGM